MRGSLEEEKKAYRREGIIPAGAGLTDIVDVMTRIVGDHPRGCGAHLARMSFRIFSLGSSPRVRGSQYASIYVGEEPGIIPAGAGLTYRLKPHVGCFRDHPRGCGAHGRQSANVSQEAGSSPRVRGSQKD